MAIERCLQFDCGNSGSKWRLLEGAAVTARGSVPVDDAPALQAALEGVPVVDAIWVASVQGPASDLELATRLRNRFGIEPWFARSMASTGVVRNSYADPARMGVDRWLAMLAGWARRSRHCAVVDAGSAMTIDLLASDGGHAGGYIIPGPALMESALLMRTGRVRFAEPAGWELAPGQSTAEAVRHGVAVALAGAVRLVIEREQVAPADVLICGGYAQALREHLGFGEWQPDLVFEGLAIAHAAIA